MITCCNVFNVWPKTSPLLPVWPRDAKMLDTPGDGGSIDSNSTSDLGEIAFGYILVF